MSVDVTKPLQKSLSWNMLNTDLPWNEFQGKLESHKEYERITEQVEVEMSSRNLEERSGQDPEDFSDSLTRAFLQERNRLKEQNSSDQLFFR